MLIRDAEVRGRRSDVRIADGHVVDIRTHDPDATPAERDGSARAAGHDADDAVLNARGGALLPGLHDHHIHLFALAADLEGVRCGPPAVDDRSALAAALRSARPRGGWLRGTGYFESVAGPLERDALDALRDDVPIRVQHRSGILWMLNTAAIRALDLDAADHPSIERDAAGRVTGRLFRADAWLRERLPPAAAPDLSALGRRLARFGVTRVTDCTASNDASALARLTTATASDALPLCVHVMGTLAMDDRIARDPSARVRVDAHKIMLDEPRLPALDALVADIEGAHARGRAVAFHAVTRTELLFALAALEAAGARAGDRVEHASVAPPEAIDRLRTLGVTIVTQPNFVAERGDDYRRDVEPRDQPDLYRLRSWLDAGVMLAAGTDAPYGDPDPWRAMRAAVDRRTASGATLGPGERLTPEEALALFRPALRPAHAAATGPSRAAEIAPGPEPGDPADLCLLDRPWADARETLSSDAVAATLLAGRPTWRRDADGSGAG